MYLCGAYIRGGSGLPDRSPVVDTCHLSALQPPHPPPFALLDSKALGSLSSLTDLTLESFKVPGDMTEWQVQGRKLRLKES